MLPRRPEAQSQGIEACKMGKLARDRCDILRDSAGEDARRKLLLAHCPVHRNEGEFPERARVVNGLDQSLMMGR